MSDDTQADDDVQMNYSFNSDITYEEVKRAFSRAKLGKSAGIDELPVEVLKMIPL